MNKSRIELIITAALAPVMIFVITKNLGVIKKQKAASPAPARPESGQAAAVEKDGELKRISAMSWARDPFVFGSAKSAEGDLVLNGIVWDEKSPSAIINGNIVNIGGQVNGNVIVDIQRGRVIVNRDGSTYELNLRRGGD